MTQVFLPREKSSTHIHSSQEQFPEILKQLKLSALVDTLEESKEIYTLVPGTCPAVFRQRFKAAIFLSARYEGQARANKVTRTPLKWVCVAVIPRFVVSRLSSPFSPFTLCLLVLAFPPSPPPSENKRTA
ncbi:uncharacterized protein LOC143188677 [Calliopsis andreniformis]|uniref:uncharacterized protein LOC143188677 n=1 Tax=Calliopsis andreniformis TaxID=337506 RepID=UPI003FCD1B6A